MKIRESKRKIRAVWHYQEINILLDYWAEYFNDLRSMKRNFKNYEEMSEKLREKHNIIKSPEEVATKILNMRKAYKKERDTGGATQWPYYERVKAILANETSNNEALLENEINMTLGEETQDSSPKLSFFAVKPEEESSNSSASLLISNAFKPLEIIHIQENMNEPTSITADRLSSNEHSDNMSSTNAKHDFSDKASTSYMAPSSSRLKASPMKRKAPKNIYSLQNELLHEIKRSNQVSEHEMKRANDIADRSLNVQIEMLDLLKSFQK